MRSKNVSVSILEATHGSKAHPVILEMLAKRAQDTPRYVRPTNETYS
jgi:hypothetical protein